MGDLKEPASLPPALAGVDAVITTAYGYAGRRKGDTLASVDDLGNRARGMGEAMDYISSGRYVADLSGHRELFGEPPRVEDGVATCAGASGLRRLAGTPVTTAGRPRLTTAGPPALR